MTAHILGSVVPLQRLVAERLHALVLSAPCAAHVSVTPSHFPEGPLQAPYRDARQYVQYELVGRSFCLEPALRRPSGFGPVLLIRFSVADPQQRPDFLRPTSMDPPQCTTPIGPTITGIRVGEGLLCSPRQQNIDNCGRSLSRSRH